MTSEHLTITGVYGAYNHQRVVWVRESRKSTEGCPTLTFDDGSVHAHNVSVHADATSLLSTATYALDTDTVARRYTFYCPNRECLLRHRELLAALGFMIRDPEPKPGVSSASIED